MTYKIKRQRPFSQEDKYKPLSESKTDLNIFNFNRDILKSTYAFPASKRLAHVHKRSIKFGQYEKERRTGQVCACCLMSVQKKPLSIFTKTLPQNLDYREDEQFPLISGVAMFFLFIKMVVIYLIFRILILDLFNFITNLNEGYDSQSIWIQISFLNKMNNHQITRVNDLLSFIMVFVSIIFFLSFRKIQYLIYEKIDMSRQTADDYALFVEGIPSLKISDTQTNPQNVKLQLSKTLQQYFNQKILDWLQDPSYWQQLQQGTIQYDYINYLNQSPQSPPKDIIKSISLCYDISELKKIQTLRKKIMAHHQQLVQNDPKDYFNISFKKQVQLLNNSQLLKTQQMTTNKDFNYEITHFVGCAFISFKYQHYRDKLLQIFQANRHAFQFRSAYLRIQQPSHPSQIKWKNFDISPQQRRNRRIISISILVMTLILTFAIILGLFILQAQSKLFQGISSAITVLVSLFTIAIDALLRYIIKQLVSWEKHKTKSQAKFSIIKKILATSFINQSLIYYVASILIDYNTNSWLSEHGLISQISTLLVVNGFMAIALNLINISNLMRKFNIWRLYSDTNDKINQYQIHVNKKYQYPQFDFAQRYTYYLVQIYTAAFYAYIVPVGIIALAFIFIIQYWVDKFNLFTRSSLFYQLDYKLTRKVIKFFQASILFYSAGALIFSFQMQGSLSTFNLMSFIMSATYVLIIAFSPKYFEKKIFQSYEKLQKYDFDSNFQKGKTQMTYWKFNPVTRFLKDKTISNINTNKLSTKMSMSIYQHFAHLG